ncbi:MAG: hypothetical protein JWP12_1424 [Bacteroidetes bacterium]|nr:hypothetical protein [Bacteroidota bacterium]
MLKQNKYSLYSIAFIFAFIFATSFYFGLWKKNRITLDAPSYYTYLPAVFIYGDLHLNYIDKDPGFFKDKIWYYKIENNAKLIKHPMGISVALSPFFLIGHLAAKITGGAQDGYSMSYQNAVSLGVLIYLFIGLYYLRKLLLQFFSDKITAITLIATVIGTNLLWYSSFEGLMPHAISFSCWCVCMYAFFQWLKTGIRKYIFAFGIVFGLIVLIRPFSLVGILYFLIYGIISTGGIKNFFEFVKPQFKNVIIAAVMSMLIVSLQFFYWKYATGKWIYDVYIDEHFLFDSPQIFPFLFSFRKGVFVYTPILIFAVIGLIRLFKTNRAIFYGTVITLALTIYILSSWWAWSYGICWGMRPMIDYYSLLSIPLAAGFAFVFSRKKIALLASTVIVLLIALNLFQTWQYKNGLIHYDDMTEEAYFKGFFQTEISPGWQDLLRPYDWDRRIKGLPQVDYSKEYFFNNFGKYTVSLRGFNQQYAAINPKAQNAVAAYTKNIIPVSLFTIQPIRGDTVCIRAVNGNFLSVNALYENALLATSIIPGASEKFIISFVRDNDNKITLQALNGNYVSTGDAFPNILSASATTVSPKETFRLFVNEQIAQQ